MALLKLQIVSQLTTKCQPLLAIQISNFHNTADLSAWNKDNDPKKFMRYNKIIYPPQADGEERRPAFVCHQRINIKYSPFKMWYVASLVRGMSVDEAIRQLKFISKKGAKDVRETIEEAKILAVKEHNVEFPSNLWVAESFVGKGAVIKGIRRHARMRFGVIKYFHCHYFVRLEEGRPPNHYYQPAPKEPSEQLQDWLEGMRKRKIVGSL